MPILGEDAENLQTTNGYKFSAPPVEELGASEYTLVTIVNDTSISVGSFKNDMEDALQTILDACQKSPRSENLLIRLVGFGSSVYEIHGYRQLGDIGVNEYTDILNIGGATALYEATHTSIDAMATYASNLTDEDFLVNGICFVITDGDDNEGGNVWTPDKIADLIKDVDRREVLESLVTVVIGVGDGDAFGQYIDGFRKNANLTQSVLIGEADPATLAKLAAFVSRSISSQSSSLGSGGPSAPLTF